MKINKLSRLAFASFAAVTFAVVASIGYACPDPPPEEGESPDHDPHTPADPAFIVADPLFTNLQKQKELLLKRQNENSNKSEVLVTEEQAQYAKFRADLKASPQTAFTQVMKAWSKGLSPDVQRLIILDTLPMVRASSESETLRLMLSALDDVSKERAECVRLAKGNGLEKSIAMKRIKLLDANPRLQLVQAP